jgi:hypothetical protein
MTVDPNDWRLTQGADKFLRGASLRWKVFKKPRPDWDHEHCSFCWAKFIDAEDLARYVQTEESGQVYTEGYTTTEDHGRGADYYWVCKPCFEEFRDYADLRQVA